LIEYFLSAEMEMLTEGLTLEATAAGADFTVETLSDTRIMLTAATGDFLPAGTFEDAVNFCLGGMTSQSPPEQEVSITWTALIGNITGTYEPDTCILACEPPADTCALLIDPVLSCDEDGVYHYSFSVMNVNDRMLDASIVVLGPAEGSSTVPNDFSQATFPDFPDHTPNGDPYLEYDETTDLIDISLPNAMLGSSYEFIISLHDYRNINPEDDEYWCCYTPVNFTIDVDIPCEGGGIGGSIEPLDHFAFPNPANESFQVMFSEPLESPAELQLMGINGDMMETEQLKAGTRFHEIQLADLNTGLYFISVVDELGNQSYSRIMKK